MITRQELQEFMWNKGIYPQLDDEQYALPSREWVYGEFCQILKSFYTQANFTYDPEEEDCDDFALLSVSTMRFYNRQTRKRRALPPAGIAYGFFGYEKGADPKKGHKIAFFVARIDGELKLFFLEPQTPGEITLTQAEIETCNANCFV